MSVEGSIHQMVRDMGEVKSQTVAELREQADTFARFIVNENVIASEADDEIGLEAFRMCLQCCARGPIDDPTKHDPGCVVARAECLVAGQKS